MLDVSRSTAYPYPNATAVLTALLKSVCRSPDQSARCQSAVERALQLAEREFIAAHGRATPEKRLSIESQARESPALVALVAPLKPLPQQSVVQPPQPAQPVQLPAPAAAAPAVAKNPAFGGALQQELAQAQRQLTESKEQMQMIEKQDGTIIRREVEKRRDAEGKLKEARALIDRLLDELETAGGSGGPMDEPLHRLSTIVSGIPYHSTPPSTPKGGPPPPAEGREKSLSPRPGGPPADGGGGAAFDGNGAQGSRRSQPFVHSLLRSRRCPSSIRPMYDRGFGGVRSARWARRPGGAGARSGWARRGVGGQRRPQQAGEFAEQCAGLPGAGTVSVLRVSCRSQFRCPHVGR